MINGIQGNYIIKYADEESARYIIEMPKTNYSFDLPEIEEIEAIIKKLDEQGLKEQKIDTDKASKRFDEELKKYPTLKKITSTMPWTKEYMH